MKKLIRVFRIIRVYLWRLNNDFKHWDKDKVKGITTALMLCSIGAQSQPRVTMSKIDDKALHVYAGMGINIATGAIIFKKTKRPGLALAGGFAASILAGAVKETVYDGFMKRGTVSNDDFIATAWGSVVGSFAFGIGMAANHSRKIEKEYFQHLNDSLQRRLVMTDTLITAR